MEIIGSLPATTELAVLVVQHMPEKFTRTFAERLDRRSAIPVREAEHDDVVRAGEVLVCPGMRCMEIERMGERYRVRVVPPALKERYYPSADRLLSSAATTCPTETIGVIMTGMADDGAAGAVALKKAGGYVIAESEETAVVYGMPRAAAERGGVHE